MKVGLGTGSTVAHLLPAIAARQLTDLRCVGTSIATEEQAKALGIPDKQASERSDSPSQAREGQLSSGESRELGARSGVRARRKRKRRKG